MARSTLPIRPPFPPMEATPADALLEGGGWPFEPKRDGFPCLGLREPGSLSLRPNLACEVRYDRFTGDRFRLGTKFLRWRPDQSPEAWTREQLGRTTPPKPFLEVFRGKESVA